MHEILFLSPVLKNCVWGGTKLSEFGYDLPSNTTGECWCTSAHPNGDSAVKGGTFDSKKLSELWHEHTEIFGSSKSAEFPILTKIIDAKDDLSIQVHPDDAYAKECENSMHGKVECWYVLEAAKDASIIIGHNAQTKTEAQKMISQNSWHEFLREIPVKKGDFFFIDSGTIHAIKGGTMIFEVQENCDITYRLYDYDRLQNGKKRELHIKKSLDVLKVPFTNNEPPKNLSKTKNTNLNMLTSCNFFSVWHANFCGRNSILQDQLFMAVTVINGSGTVDQKSIKKGDTFILPHDYGTAEFCGNLELMISAV